jgi:serine/threonine-protein kinase
LLSRPVPANPTASQQLLRQQIELDAPLRERSVTTFMTWVTTACTALCLLLTPMIGPKLGFSLGGLLSVLAVYYAVLGRALKNGWYQPQIRWVNVAIEVSTPSLIFILDAATKGPEYALSAPTLVLWGTLVALSGLRCSRSLALGAGAIAALEYVAVYVFFALPDLPAGAMVTFKPTLFAVRVLLLFLSGVVTAAYVGHLNRRAEEALAAARQRDLLGKYVLHERIGSGGMAEVFRATYSPEGGFEKTVAIKKVLPAMAQDDEFVTLFRAEAELCSHLNHANIVQVLDFGRFHETYFLAMEYVEGLPLHRLLKAFANQGMPLSAVTYLGVELCRALDYVHTRRGPKGEVMNLIHRDLNPPNILVSNNAEVKLTDFGIARAAAGVAVTQVGMIKGKPGYLAPEQRAGTDLDARVDLFALGVTLWEALVGMPLFPATRDEASLDLVLTQKPVPPSAARSEVPKQLDAVVMGLLARERAQRTPSAEVALGQLLAIAGPAAAFPGGQAELTKAVAFAMGELVRKSAAAVVTMEVAAAQQAAREEQVTQASIRKR